MAGANFFSDQMQLMTPHTFNALSKLVLSMAKVNNNAGKKTFFGKDKGQESYSKFLGMLKNTLQSMVLDGVINESTSSEDAMTALTEKLEKFSLAYPNWQDAYSFATMFFVDKRNDAISTIERLRSIP